MKASILFVALLSVSLSAYASFGATDVRQILAEQRGIRDQAEAPLGKYSRFSEQAQARLYRAQDVIFEILADGRALEQLDPNTQVRLMNAVEEVKAVLSENEGDKLECWRERKTGTSMKVTRCETVAQRERLREEARHWKSRGDICVQDGGCRQFSNMETP